MSNENRQLSPAEGFKQSLNLYAPQFKAALPAHIPVERFVRNAMTLIVGNPAILSLEKNSLIQAVLEASQRGVLVDGKESAIVPFGGKAKFMIMTAGILKLMRNSGQLASLTAQIVHAKDDFQFWIDGDGEHINHRPNMFSDRGEIIGAYALGKTKDGSCYVEVLSNTDINAIESVSKSNNSPWKGPFRSEMIKKSAIRRLSKRMPTSTDIENAIHSDDDFYELKTSDFKNSEIKNSKPELLVEAPAKPASRLQGIVDATKNTDIATKAADIVTTSEEVPI